MGSLSSPTPAEASTLAAREVVVVADFGNPVAADYAAHARSGGDRDVVVLPVRRDCRATSIVMFLGERLSECNRRRVDELLEQIGAWRTEFIAVVSSYRVHLGDRGGCDAEEYVVTRAAEMSARTVVFRPAHVLSASSSVSVWLRRFGCCYPLVPRRLRGCCIDGAALYAAIETERGSVAPRPSRVLTLLGPNRPWRERLLERRGTSAWSTCVTLMCTILSWLMIGQIAALAIALLARRWPTLRCCALDTLRPGSFDELLALDNPYNYRHVKVVGYNNGVVHFGHRYPGKTVVSTVRCNRVAQAGDALLRADCGATVRRALDFLAGTGQELPVVPNYSYVALGTAFFVPIHGSAADCSTIADTIARAVLYDPVRDRIFDVTRDDPLFREYVYNLDADVLLLELYLRLKPKSRYYVRREVLQNPGSDELLAVLRDTTATNVEIRKANAAADAVTVARYYQDVGESDAVALELPRDALGRLWDRLEENPITSFLMHALTRHLAWHVELFFTAEEFATFWASHRALPLRKLQLRYIRRDGLPHSAFRDHDCVSVDLFMFRRQRRRFEDYLKQSFAVVRSNPGKHSQ